MFELKNYKYKRYFKRKKDLLKNINFINYNILKYKSEIIAYEY